MKRETFRAVITDASGEPIAQRDAYSWNSAVRASEALVREYGRMQGYMLTGTHPSRLGACDHGKFCHCADTYARTWATPSGLEIRATVAQVTA